MPSGPKKRQAARRRSIGASGTRLSLDRQSISGSHASDEGGISPKTPGDVNTRLSVATGSGETPDDQTSFHTEEWVRVSDFDVGTPTSTTAKSDYDAAAEESYGDARTRDKLVDWETVSRENAGNSSSAEDVGEAENVAVDYSSGSGKDHGKKHIDKGLSDSSDKEDDAKSVSSSAGGKRSDSSSSSSSSGRSTVRSSTAFPKKSDSEERSSSIVVVPSHEDESQESSYAEVASVETRDDDSHGVGANYSSPDAKEVEGSTIEPVSSSDEQEGANFDPFAGVENQASSCSIEPASSEEEEEEKYGLFTDVSNLKDLIEQAESEGDFPSRYDKFSSFLSSRMNEPESGAQDLSEVTDANTEEHLVPESKEVGPDVKESQQQVVDEVRPEGYASDQNIREGTRSGEFAESIEPSTPEKSSEKSVSENLHAFEHSISDEELAFEPEHSSHSEGKHHAVPEDPSEVRDESIAKEFQDAPSFSSGIPEPDQHELDQLLEIAHSKEIANLGKQEEKLLAQEERDVGKGIVAEPQPLVDVLSATDDPKPLEGGELKDLQPVVAEESPLLKDSSTTVDTGFQIEAELKEKAPELFKEESEDKLREDTVNVGSGDYAGTEQQVLEGKLSKGSSSSSSSSSVDHESSLQLHELPTENEDATLVPLSSLPDSELPKISPDPAKDIGVTSLADHIEESKEISSSSEKSELVTIASQRKIEEQGRPSRTSSDSGGCCEPLQWLFGYFTRSVPRSIAN